MKKAFSKQLLSANIIKSDYISSLPEERKVKILSKVIQRWFYKQKTNNREGKIAVCHLLQTIKHLTTLPASSPSTPLPPTHSYIKRESQTAIKTTCPIKASPAKSTNPYLAICSLSHVYRHPPSSALWHSKAASQKNPEFPICSLTLEKGHYKKF